MAFTLKTLAASLAITAGLAQAGTLHTFTSDANGFNTHSIWYDDGQEVTVVDAQFTPGHAEQLLADIRKQTKSPITRIVVTHPSPDKFNGLATFHAAGVQSIASKQTAMAIPGVDAYKRYYWVNLAKAFTDATYPKVEAPTTHFSGTYKITLKSRETISLIELPLAGVASTQTVVRIDKTGDLIVGDLVHDKTHAWLEGGIVGGKPAPNLVGWKAGLKQLLSLGKGTVYGGRGQFRNVAQAVPAQIAYLDKVNGIVDAYIATLGARAAELSDSAKQKDHYAALQTQIAQAFPDYAMPELIGYSIYGLVNSKLPVSAKQK